MKNARKTHWKMGCASLFVVIRYSFVERAEPTFFIRGHSRGASGFLCMHKIVRGVRGINVHATRTPDMRGERWTNAGYTRSTRSVFVVCSSFCSPYSLVRFWDIWTTPGILESKLANMFFYSVFFCWIHFCCLPSCISCGFAPSGQNPRWLP